MSDRTHPDSGPGAVYAALPEPITYQIAALKACEHGDALVGWRVEPSRQSFDASMRPKRKLYTEGNMHDFADRTHALRVSHWQAPAPINLNCKSEQKRLATLWGFVPAQAAPATVAGCTRSHPHENMDNACRAKAAIAEMRSKAARGAEATAHDLDRFVVMLTSAPTTQPAPQQPGVGNSGFDHKTAADFLNGKTVSDEAMRKFVAASRWAHNDRAGLQATLLSVRRELAYREAEIALFKTSLMNAEAAAKQGGAA